MNKILVIGSTPPPHLGQAIMTKYLIDIESNHFKFYYVNLSFSKNSTQFGKINFFKILSLIKVFVLIIYFRIFHKCKILYYNPSGHRYFPIIRDILILWWSRKLFNKTIFHFHAYGINIVYKKMNKILKVFFRLSFFKPDIMIKLTQDLNDDELLIKPLKTEIIANGIEDNFTKYGFSRNNSRSKKFKLLYVGAIYEERGILDLINLVVKLKKSGINDLELIFVGDFVETSFKKLIYSRIDEFKIRDKVIFKGELIGKKKFREFNSCDILVFPSRVPSETFGLVIVEAMQFYKPSIITNLNGPKYVIENQIDSVWYESQNIDDFEQKLLSIKNNKHYQDKLSLNARANYEKKYSLEIFQSKISKVFMSLD